MTNLLVYSNIPGRRDSFSINDSMSIWRGFTKYPMSGRILTGNFLPLHCKASFRGNRWWRKWTWTILFIVWPGSREWISSIGTNVGTSLKAVEELQYGNARNEISISKGKGMTQVKKRLRWQEKKLTSTNFYYSDLLTWTKDN